MGVKSPVTGTGSTVADGLAPIVAEGVTVAVGSSVGVALGVGVGLEVILGVTVGPNVGVGLGVFPEGVATKAGTSPACTIKFLVRVLVIPDASSQEIVIE